MALLKKKTEDSADIPPGQNQNKVQEQPVTDRNAINPAIDQKITDYANANPKYVEYLNNLSKERLIRKLLYEDVKALEAKQNLDRGFHQLAVSNPALMEAVREIRATQPPEKQEQEIARLAQRDDLDKEAVRARMHAQPDIIRKMSLVDEVIDNSGSCEETRYQVNMAFERFLKKFV